MEADHRSRASTSGSAGQHGVPLVGCRRPALSCFRGTGAAWNRRPGACSRRLLEVARYRRPLAPQSSFLRIRSWCAYRAAPTCRGSTEGSTDPLARSVSAAGRSARPGDVSQA
jgi:hypothetical protein